MSVKNLKLPSSPCQIAVVESFLKKITEEYSIAPDIYPNMLISLTEAVNNAIIHGNQRDENKFVKISIAEKNKSIIFTIADEGNGFNPSKLPDPTSAQRIECDGGRGVYIMRTLSDDLSYMENGRKVQLSFNIG